MKDKIKEEVEKEMTKKHLNWTETAIDLTIQKTNEWWAEKIDDKIEAFLKVRKGVVKNEKVCKVYDTIIRHLIELKRKESD